MFVHKICHFVDCKSLLTLTIYAHIISLAFNAIVGEDGKKEKATFNTDADAAHIFAASQSS